MSDVEGQSTSALKNRKAVRVSLLTLYRAIIKAGMGGGEDPGGRSQHTGKERCSAAEGALQRSRRSAAALQKERCGAAKGAHAA